jgi:uncharacterized protein YhhL (DUF1145 family)
MTITQIIVGVYAVLILGLMMPFSSGVRTALFMALILVSAMTLAGGGAQYAISLVQ